MYAIVNVVYGVPLTRDKLAEMFNEMQENGDDELPGVIGYYSGSSDTPPAAFGVDLDEFDEATDYTDIAELHLQPTEGQKELYQELLSKLPSKYQDILAKRTPFVFLLWSTS